jgi:predicted nucleic acid-binding protein
MIAPVFVDTNVLVYARDASEPSKKTRAAEWLRELWL